LIHKHRSDKRSQIFLISTAVEQIKALALQPSPARYRSILFEINIIYLLIPFRDSNGRLISFGSFLSSSKEGATRRENAD
jgi:hypothetical protein